MTDHITDISILVDQFISEYKPGIENLHRIHFKTNDELSLRAHIAELTEELITGAITFLNKERPLEELNPYLFYIVNAFFKKIAYSTIITQAKTTTTEYICPGCLYLGKTNQIVYFNNMFRCDSCSYELKENACDQKKVDFFKTFYKHNKNGYRCNDCNRFIPNPFRGDTTIICPYFDCCYVGSCDDLKGMRHPIIKVSKEVVELDKPQQSGNTMHEAIAANHIDAHTHMEVEQDIASKIKLLKEIIGDQRNSVIYSSSDFTIKHKDCIYAAFGNLLQKYPTDMVGYLVGDSMGYSGLQCKIFQEYIRLLEEALPFSFKKKKKVYTVDSLLDENICLFDGISNFDGVVNENGVIKNGTTEFYIGGRKGAITKPYYIGKLLFVRDRRTKDILNDKVVEYTFSLIKMRDVKPRTKVSITHLRVKPHYQMGGMAHVNRIRKKIVERVKLVMKGNEE